MTDDELRTRLGTVTVGPVNVDLVNAPPHYTFGGPQYEVIVVLEAWGLDKDFLLGNVVKYTARAGRKGKAKEVEDLEKARWYLDRKIANLKKAAT